MMRPGAKVKKVYLYPKPVDFRKSIDGLSALVELDIKAAVFDPVLFVFLNRARNRLEQTDPLHRSGSLANRQQPSRTRYPSVRHWSQELVVQ